MSEVRQPVWLNPEEVPPLPNGWRTMSTEEACVQLKPGKLFDSKTVSESGTVPVLNQSETGILGYHNEEPGVQASPDVPVVTFANHTCAMRLMKQPFSTIQNIFPKVGKPGVTDTTYFYYATLGRVGLSDYKGHHPIFRRAHIPVPPLPTQRRIAGILSAYDELIENSQRRIKILEAMASALYREWFVHFRFPGHESVPRVPSPLGEIPQGWDRTTFTQAAFFENGDRGKNYPNGSDFVDEGIPFINAGHLVGGAVDHAGMNYILEEKFGQLRGGKIRKGDILFCLRGSPGRTARTAGLCRGAIASSLVIIRPTDRANEAFLYHTLVGDVGKRMATELNNGAAQPNVSVGSIQKYPLLLPSMDLLREFAKSIEPIWRHTEILRNQLSNLRCQRDLLMPRLLSGQINLSWK